MIMKKLVLAVLFGFVSCEPVTTAEDTIFDWLEGKWEAQTREGKFFESWSREDGDLVANAGEIIKADTVFKEYIKLIKIKEHWCYIPVIGKQQPIIFALRSGKDGVFSFENKEHDFPTCINYKRMDENNVQVDVIGVNDQGEEINERYELKRIK